MKLRYRLLLSGLMGSGFTYLLRDTFSTDRAAGAVNGTSAEPTGTRGVVDTTSKISITGGELFINGGSGTFGNTALWLTPSITRLFGRTLKIDFRLPAIPNNASILKLGYNNAGTGNVANNMGMLIDALGVFNIRRTSAANSPVVGTLAALTQYEFWEVLRTQGAYFFLRDGSTYRFLYEHQWDTTSPLFAQVTAREVSVSQIYVTEMTVPELLFEVTAEASDSFNRADGALGSTDGAGHLEANSGSGLAWASNVGTWAIASNLAVSSALSGGIAVATVDGAKADVFATAKLVRSAGNVGLVVRYVDVSNYIYAYHDGTNATLRKVVAGVDSAVIAATAATYAASAKLTITSEGTAFQLFYNDIRIGTGTIADAALQVGTKVGLYTSDTGNSFNDFTVWKRTDWGAIDL